LAMKAPLAVAGAVPMILEPSPLAGPELSEVQPGLTYSEDELRQIRGPEPLPDPDAGFIDRDQEAAPAQEAGFVNR